MAEYEMGKQTDLFLQWEGRILKQQRICYLGYTNSSVTFYAKGQSVYMYFVTGENEVINQPGLRVYVDGETQAQVVLDKRTGWYFICNIEPEQVHEIRLVKITEAAMSYAGLAAIRISEGELLPYTQRADDRVKVEFIGDSITCGYGVHGEPESEYTIREEDGECSYAAFMAKKMNWNARWISASGYGMCVEYTGNPDNNVPKLYPYVNWFVDQDTLQDMKEFEPDYIFINLGTNDSGHLHKENIKNAFLTAYKDFLRLLRKYHEKAVLICVLGTLCEGVFPYIEQIVKDVKTEGIENIYAMELPYHNVQQDGMASMHPSIKTHKKDAERILEFMRRENIL